MVTSVARVWDASIEGWVVVGGQGPQGEQGEQGEQGPPGEQGQPGVPGGGYLQTRYNWIAAATTGGIASGRIGVNHDQPSNATLLILHRLNHDATDIGLILSGLVVGDHIYLQANNNAESFHRYTITGLATPIPPDENNWSIPVITDSGSAQGTEPQNGAALMVAFQYTPAQGPPGAGVPVGGTTGQILAKIDSTDRNTQWVSIPKITVASSAPGSPAVNDVWIDTT